MRTRDRVTSACQRWWLWTTVTCNLPVDAHPTGGGVARARTGAPHQSGSERARYASPAQNRRRPGFPVEGGRARASLGAALGAGRPWSDLVTNHVVRTVSKVLCLRSLRTSRCCWAVPVAVAASRNHTLYSCFYSWHAMCAAAGWYVELTERGFLQELGSDCGHMAARNAPKQLQCLVTRIRPSNGRRSGLVIVCEECVRQNCPLRLRRAAIHPLPHPLRRPLCS